METFTKEELQNLVTEALDCPGFYDVVLAAEGGARIAAALVNRAINEQRVPDPQQVQLVILFEIARMLAGKAK